MTGADAAFAAVQAAFERAAARPGTPLFDASYHFAGRPVRLRIAGARLAPQLAAVWAHLEAPPVAAPTLRIDLWDEAESGVAAPPLPDGAGGAGAAEHRVLELSPDARFLHHVRPAMRVCLDRQRAHLVGCAERADALSLNERGRPLHLGLSLWLRDHGVQVVHAGLVALDGVGVLLGGSGGAGKSTSSIACALGGFAYLGDDSVGIEEHADGSFTGHSLYGSTSFDPHHLARLPPLPGRTLIGSLPGEDKHVVLLSGTDGVRLGRHAPIRALVLPRVAGGPATRLRQAAKGEALRTITPSSLLAMLPRPGRDGFERLARLTARLPCYWLELGEEISEVPARMRELLSEIRP